MTNRPNAFTPRILLEKILRIVMILAIAIPQTLTGAVAVVSARALAAPSTNALQLNGSTNYVGFGTTGRDNLGTATFTLELWFKRSATVTGVTVSTGTGGVSAIPLLTKGMGEADGDTRDCNYFLGIRGSDNVLVADFEDSTNGLNHPVAGITSVPQSDNNWHHAAATYDGLKWQLFLDGKLEAELNVGKSPRSNSNQYAALGTAMTSLNQNPNGYFAGALDEARVWNYARTQAEILSTMNVEIASPDNTKLLGYWRMNDGSGTTLADSSGRAIPVPGTITGATWVPNAGFPINVDAAAPATPTGLAVAAGDRLATLTWTANVDSDLRGYNIYRSTGTPVPTTNPINGANLVTTNRYVDGGLTNGTPYYYVVKAVDSSGNMSGAPIEVSVTPASASGYSMQFNGSSQYVTFGRASRLGVETFTIEGWFKRSGTGVTVDTGGVVAEPLITKGRGEADGSNVDMNYFIGIRQTDGYLVADYEDGSNGANHPIIGTTSVVDGLWHHVALAYEPSGTNMLLKLYLDGALQNTVTINKLLPRADSIQHAAIGSALNSTGVAAGYFNGLIDEVRIWNYARSLTDINTNKSLEIFTAPGLIGRWGFNEGAGTLLNDTSGIGTNGTLINTPLWVSDTPFGIPPTPPSAPSGLGATATYSSLVTLTWTDNSSNETGFEVHRSTSGVGGTYTLFTTTAAGAVTYPNSGLTPLTEYCYKVRAVNGAGPSAFDGPICATTLAESSSALQFDGVDDYVTFGNVSGLGVTNFTLETWFNWTGGGVTMTTSGTQGLPSVYPLISKGRGEEDGSNKDMNYFLGIDSVTKKLAVDFEDTATGMNWPFVATLTEVTTNTWHHAAVTYDSVTAVYTVYLDGVPVGTSDLGSNVLPRADSIQHAGIASAMTSTGAPAGYFQGKMDEARIWNVVRSQSEIRATINQQLYSGTGLIARWGMGEGSGTTTYSSVGTFPGTLTNGPVWVTPGAPFNIVFDTTPPAAPTGLTSIGGNTIITLDWADNSETDLAGYNVYRGTELGVYSKVNTALVTASTYMDTGLTNNTEYFYVVRAVDSSGNESGNSDATSAYPTADMGSALEFTTASGTYVTFGDPAKLDLAQFTIETWFKRTGTGTSVTTGGGGIANAIPLVAHGAQQDEATTNNANWMLVIDDSSDVLAADFEDMASGANHPVLGVTPITDNVWHHAAATYDGTTWKLYLDGKLDATLVVGAAPRSDTLQHAALGSMLNTTGGTNGFFQGVLDEARVWNRALTQGEILSTINQQITSGSGLVARWGLNEGTGTVVTDSIATAANGTIMPATGANYAWVPGAPFNVDMTPTSPSLVAPANNATGVSTSPTLTVAVDDPTDSNLTVTFYGRVKNAPAPDFTLIAIPDAQYYASTYPSIYNDQMNWVVAEKTTRNIKYVVSLGDQVNTAGTASEWTNATTAFDILTTGGVPYGLAAGNHDGAPDATGSFNTAFGSRKTAQTATYGGRYGTADYDNYYTLFSASGMDFIVFFIEYDDAMTSTSHPVLAWANTLLSTTYSSRRAIVVTHNLLQGGTSTAFSTQGSTIYNALKGNPNLFLMLGGHLDIARHRSDTFNSNIVYSLRSDYQMVDSQQSGYLRIMRFSPTDNMIHVSTWSTTQDKFYPLETAYNDFTLAYPMNGSAPFTVIGTANNVPAGTNASITWAGRLSNTEYEWYAVSSNGAASATSGTWSFTTETASNQAPVVTDIPNQSIAEGSTFTTINLDDYVSDADNTNAQMTWTYSGNTQLTVSITNRVATISAPNADWNGAETITFRATDPGALWDEDAATFTVWEVNDAPDAVNDSATMAEDSGATSIPVLVNDLKGPANESAQTLTITGVTQGASGAVVITGGGTGLTYTPAANYYGADSFTYTACDNGTTHGVLSILCDTATVSVTVSPVNDAPQVTNPGAQTSAEGAVISLQITATDVDGPSLTYSASNLPDGLSINTSTGLISGSITYHALRSYSSGVTVTDGTTPVTVNFTWNVTQVAFGPCASETGLVGCWQMEEGSGTVIYDGSSAGNDGALLGGPTFTTGKVGTYALSMSGSSQYGNVPDNDSLDLTATFTISGWIKPGKSGTQDLFKKATLATGADTNGYEIGLSGTTYVFFRINQTVGPDTYRINSTTKYPTDGITWMHVAATYSGGTMRLYINGVQEGGDKAAPSPEINSLPFTIGAQMTSPRYYQGAVDDVRLYNRTLSLAEIQVLAGVTPTVTISGNAGIAGVTLSYTDVTPKIATANGSGDYTITVPSGWSGTVTPSLAGYSFTPTGRTYTNVLASLTGENYTAAAITYAISGNAGVAGASINFTGGTPVTANGSGVYTITVPYNWSGTVTPSLAGYSFTPPNRTYTNVLASLTGENYTATADAQTQNIPLVTGWNLVSFNLHPTNTAIADVLSSVVGSYDLVYAWDATGSHSSAGNWMKYDPNTDPFVNTLSALDEKMGFWIHMTSPATLTVQGSIVPTSSISLFDTAGGWNLVSYPSASNLALPGALEGHGVAQANYTLVYAYHASDTSDSWKLYDHAAPAWANDLVEMAPGWGYWIFVHDPDTWEVGY